MTTPFIGGRFQAIGAAGIVPGARLWTYAAGTLTPLATYTTAAGTSANTNPVVCDTAGQADVWLAGAVYRMRLFDALGVLLWDEDGIAGSEAKMFDAALRADFANRTDAAKGAALAGFALSLNYAAGTIGAILTDNMVNVAGFLTDAERAQVKASGTTIDLAPKINAAKAWAGHRPLYLMAGLWSVAPDVLDFRGWYGGLVGDGMDNTIVKARSTGTNIINALGVADVLVSPFVLQGLTLHGDGKVTSIIDIRYRHHYRMQDCQLRGATAQNLNARDSWNNTHDNVRFIDTPVGVHLIGSNHRNAFYGCSFDACGTWGLSIGKAGTANDGNDGILLSNCDIEFGAAGGGGILFDGSSLTLDTCYVGENIDGPAIQCAGGIISIQGGALFYGWAATSIGVQANGGKVCVERARLNAQTFPTFDKLAVGAGGKVIFAECQISTPLGGEQVMTGDPLDYGPAGQVFAKRLGRSMASSALNATRTELLSGNAITCTCATVTGSPAIITITNPLVQTRPEWREGEALYLLVVYLSNKQFNVRLAGGAFGASPVLFVGSLPATGGTIKTYIKLGNTISAANYDRVEFYTDTAAVGDYLKIEECIVADSRMLDPGSGNVGNLYKC